MRRVIGVAVGVGWVLAAAPAQAHEGHAEEGLWTTWHFDAAVILPALLIAAVYIAGLRRRRRSGSPGRTWRHAAFLGGLLIFLLALVSPVDAVGDRLFSAHQGEHMLLRIIGPALLVLGAPQATLILGLPGAVRRKVVPELVTSNLLRLVFAPFAHPVGALLFFAGAAYVWQIPSLHDRAVLDEGVHALMHATMIASGLIFWWRIFETRTAAPGLSHRTRLMMLWLALLANVLLGAWTTLKSDVLYVAYDTFGRPWLSGATDEQIGGFIIWMPGSMMFVIALIAVIHSWGRYEEKAYGRRTSASLRLLLRAGDGEAASALPSTGAEMLAQQKSGNQRLAVGLAVFSLGVLGAVFAVGVLTKTIHF